MSSPSPILSTIIFVFALQSIVLGILIVMKRPKTTANTFLSLLVFFFALIAFNIALINVLITYDRFPIFRYVQLELLFGIGPALYFYTKSITDAQFSFQKKDFIHFIPVIIEFVFYRTSFYRLGADGMYQDPVHPYTNMYLTEQWLGVWSITIYTLVSLRVLHIHQNWLKQQYASIEERSLKWLRIPVIVYSIYWIGWRLISELDRIFFASELREVYFLPTFVVLSIVTCWIGFKGYLHTTHHTATNPSEKKPEPKRNQDTQAMAEKVTAMMVNDQPYLDPDLDLTKLAGLLHMNPKQVSYIINNCFGKNFYEYVNDYRVEAFKQRLKEEGSERITLLGHAFECGFTSKSTFNHVFKKNTGLTPREYAKQIEK